MTKLAGGSLFLGLTALFGSLFYFQPSVEAKPYFTKDYSQENLLKQSIRENNQSNIQTTTQQVQQLESPTSDSSKEAIENAKSEGEFVSEARHFKATAYCLKGRTATGSGVRRGIVAADRRVLPLGSRIQVDAGAYSGMYTVADTGGAVKGNVLDIWVPSCSEAVRFGRRSVKVSVMSKKRNS